MAGPDNPERRVVPPVSLEVIAYQVDAVQREMSRALASMERTIDRGLSDLRIEVAGLTNRISDMEKQWERVDARVLALETFKRETEEAAKSAAITQRADYKLALDDSAEARITRKIFTVVAAALGAAGTVTAILVAFGVFH